MLTHTIRFGVIALSFTIPLCGCMDEDSRTTADAEPPAVSEHDPFAGMLRSALALEGTIDSIEGNSVSPSRLAAIHQILKHTSELEIHRMQGATTNEVFVNEDGREAVFDSNHKLVQDGVNDGSYNYFHPSDDPLRHFTFDIAPWILLGHTPEDPTSVEQRVRAYVADVSQGVRLALEDARQSESAPDAILDQVGAPEAVAVFLKAMQLDEGEDVADLFEVDDPISGTQIDSAVERLGHGLGEVFGNASMEGLQ